MDPSEYEYLQPGFNPSKYKVAQLRGVLVRNDVSFPSSAKKQDLVDLFNERIRPTAAQKLKELEGVVANHDRIEIVPKKVRAKTADPSGDAANSKKKRKSSRNTTSELSSVEPETSTSTTATLRKSPRKVSKTELVVKEDTAKIGSIPELKAGTKQTARKSVKVTKPPPKALPLKKLQVQASPTNNESITHAISVSDSDSDSDESAVETVTEEEFERAKRSPFKVGIAKIESSFSNDNVFQSPTQSSPDAKSKKIIPRKRTAESNLKSPKKPVKHTRKTAFSSSPEPQQPLKSPLKNSLAISKFESSSPALGGNSKKDFFGQDLSFTEAQPMNEIFAPEPAVLDSVIEPVVHDEVLASQEVFVSNTPSSNHDETPQQVNTPIVPVGSSPQYYTPSKSVQATRRSLIPDFSKFKVSPGFAKTLGFGTKASTDDVIHRTDIEDGDLELLHNEEDEKDQDQTEKETTIVHNDDSSLLNLQNEIESANETVLRETEDAIKQVNDIFSGGNDEEEAGTVEELKASEPTYPLVNWWAVAVFFKQLTIFLLFALLTVFGLWYREQRVLVGYCGSEIYQPAFPGVNNEHIHKLEDFLDTVKPSCLPCPENAICLPAMKIRCKQDFIATEHWYKLYGLLPFSDYCVKDQEKENIINEVVAKSLDLLRTRNAEIKCGDGDDLEVGISDEELYEFFYNSKRHTIGDDEFNEIWEKVLKDLESEPEITVRQVLKMHLISQQSLLTLTQLQFPNADYPGSSINNVPSDEDEEETDLPHKHRKTIFRSTSHVKLSVSCKFKKEIYERVAANKGVITGLVSGLIVTLLVYYKMVKYQEKQSKIREIADIIVTKLQKQQINSIKDTTGLTNRYLSAIQLRDELLSTMVNNKKFQLWDSILLRLERNSNIRSSTKEIHGEIVRVLEWIGE